jgi:ATP-dependent helicase HrpB
LTYIQLPVEETLDTLKKNLSESNEVVLEAPPGAGKTTLVPLALMDEPWLAGRKIVMLEPRRIATKSAAYRMSSLINEKPGQRVGYRMRLDSKIGTNTRIEIITEGILTRMLQDDPTLEDVGLVIFDEFHERNLDSDLALALCLKGQQLFNSDNDSQRLRILVMSATLDSIAISKMLDHAPIVKSEGRAYPVDIIYGRARKPNDRIVDHMVSTIKQALLDNPESSVLAFLPGQGEIHRCADALSDWLLDSKISGIHLRPLYGNLSIEQQQQAIAPLSGKHAREQKVVLATNIAETSLTIEGIDIVVDSGLARESRFDPATGMSGLHTVKISRASSDQRAGRAGRLREGKCYRLWSAEQQNQLAAHGSPEILNTDLAPFALQLLQWGIDDPDELSWMDPPPKGPWQQAIDLLQSLGALEIRNHSHVLTTHGQSMCALPVHPRLAHLLICGAEIGFTKKASLIASMLSDRDPFSRDNPDISHHLDIVCGETKCPAQHQGWLRRTQQLAQQLEHHLLKLNIRNSQSYLLTSKQLTGYLLACAYPDRIARRRHSGGFQLANGRSANLPGQHYLAKSRWLAVAEVSNIAGSQGDAIRSATALDEILFEGIMSDFISTQTVAEWDKKTHRFIAEQQQKIGALILKRKTLEQVPTEVKTAALIQTIQQQGLQLLKWSDELKQWCARVNILRQVQGDQLWPDLTEESLLKTVDNWLTPYLDKVNSLQDFKKLDLKSILQALLPWDKQQQLNELAPLRLTVPSGSSIAINYNESPPVLAVKLQEMFGCEQTPTIAKGKVALLVHLLSPAGRPLQITQDLAGFWRSSYHDVKKDMKGRYPKHPWPDNPMIAIATRKTKAHSR